MEPAIAAIVGALAVGAKDVADQMVKDLYGGLKSLILRKFGHKEGVKAAVQQVEQQPEAGIWAQALEHELISAGAAQDAEFLTHARSILDQLRQRGVAIGPVHQAKLDGSGAIAQGSGAIAAGAGGIALGRVENFHGNISTGKIHPRKGLRAVTEEQEKRLQQLRNAFEGGLLDEDTYRAAVAGLEAVAATVAAELTGSGAISRIGRTMLTPGSRPRARWDVSRMV